MNRSIIIIVLLVLLFSCSKKERVSYEPPLFETEEELSVDIINDDYLFRTIYFIDIYDSLLIVCDPSINPIIHIFNKNNGTFIASGGGRGKGPGELITPMSFSFDHNEGQLYVYDVGKNAIVRFGIDGIISKEDDYYEEIRFNNGQNVINQAFYLKDHHFILRRGEEETFATKDSIFDVVISEGPPTMSDLDWRLLLSTHFLTTITPNGDNYILGTTIGGVLYIYSINDKKMTLDAKKYFYDPAFQRKGSILNIDESIYGFCGLYASNNYIYSIIFGEKAPQDLPKSICKFDLKGNPVVRYSVDYPVEEIATDDVDIYMVVYKNGELALAKARLPVDIKRDM